MVGYADRMRPKRPLYEMFSALPHRYDLINRVMTWGLDNHWRRQAAEECLACKPRRVLDLACGTGELAISLARRAESEVEIAGIDFSPAMLELAIKKAQSLSKKISFSHGDAADLPFPDGYFDSVGISFAFRNLSYKNPLLPQHLAEVLRVLSAGGRFVIVETSQPSSKLVRKLYHRYLRWFVLTMGTLLSGNRNAYRYLAESAARFYTPEELTELLTNAGFRQVSFRPLFWGAIGLHIAIK